MKNTRSQDLEELDQLRTDSTHADSRRHHDALMVAVYEMSKDATLESLRRQLMEAMNRGDMHEMNEIRIKVQEYAASGNLKKNIAAKIERQAGTKEAEIFFKKKLI